jgi:hypothetical protein
MIGCISPNIGNCEQTLNTLRYADRVKERNAETGDFVAGASLPTSRPPTMRLSSLNSSVDSQASASVAAINDVDGDADTASQGDSSVSAMLDDLLSSPPIKQSTAQRPDDDDDDGNNNGGRSEVSDGAPVAESASRRFVARETASQLISCHKEAMTRMLEMLREEMDLVNSVDSDNGGLDQYIARINELQEEQLSYIVSMREQLLRYHAARTSISLEPSEHDLLEDSFEDLRD